jgi:hypothetical protein
LFLLAGGLMLPLALAPVPLNDSHWINLTWSEQFTALMRQGVVWPRWLPWSHDGLGAPVFYFYGPVAFWTAGLLGLCGLGTWPSLLGAAFIALVSSGIAMHAFLRGHSQRPLPGAAFYMAAPYHLLDFARRGALAEFTAIALLPLVGIGIRRAVQGRPAILAVAYALLIMTHLPSALLASIFLIPMVSLIEGSANKIGIARISRGLVLGGGIAAAYLLPALVLQRFAAMTTMQGLTLLRPANWTVATFFQGSVPALLLLAAIGLSLAITAVILLATRRDRWGIFVLGIVGLALGLVPPVWGIPPLDRVQFPWRMLPLAEFGTAVLIARSRLAGPRLLLACYMPLLLSILVLVPSLAAIGTDGSGAARQMQSLLRRHPDVVEYLPSGHGESGGSQSGWALKLAARTPPVQYAGGMTTLRRFVFPIWRIHCSSGPVPSTASPDGLLRYRGDGCAVEQVRPPIEQVGLAISLVALLLTVLTAVRLGTPRILATGRHARKPVERRL